MFPIILSSDSGQLDSYCFLSENVQTVELEVKIFMRVVFFNLLYNQFSSLVKQNAEKAITAFVND